MPDRVKVGVVGTSWFSDVVHLTNLASYRGARIEAICGRNRERCEQLAVKYEIPHCLTDYREMIEKADLDAIVIATPEDLHYEISMAAIDAGLHVLCEKALALRGEQAIEMYRKAEDVGVKHMTYFTYRWYPCYRYLKQIVDEGYIGDVFDLSVQYWANHGRSEAIPIPWGFNGKRCNGALSDMGSHMIDLVHWIVGDIVEVGATLECFIEREPSQNDFYEPVNDTAFLSVKTDRGAVGTLAISAATYMADRIQEQLVTLHGGERTLECGFSMKRTDFSRGVMYGKPSVFHAHLSSPSVEYVLLIQPLSVPPLRKAGCRKRTSSLVSRALQFAYPEPGI